MKKKLWLVYVTMISTSLLAQEASPHAPYVQQDVEAAAAVSNTPATTVETPPAATAATATVPEATNVPEAKPAKKAPAAKAAPGRAASRRGARNAATAAKELKTVPLVPGPAVVVAHRVNVRGQAKLRSEVLTQLTNRQPVTVLGEVKLEHSGPQEPSVWARILLPPGAHTWVHGAYIDPTNMTVIPRRLNIRGGPGENYSILGRLERGETVKELRSKGRWLEIEPPTNAYAFVAAEYLSQASSELAAATPEETATVAETPVVAEAGTNAPVLPENMMETNEVPAAATNELAVAATNEMAMAGTNEMTEAETNGMASAETEAEQPPPPHIVQREGIVRYTASIQAPSMFELIGVDSHKPIDFLYTTSTNLDLNRYKGLHIIVTGEEGLDDRWKTTPIISIQRIQVID